jgi:outer membrane protein assembly factor BamB
MTRCCICLVRGLFPAVLSLGLASLVSADNWPAWRGPDANGHCRERNLPLKWSPHENIRWKTPLPDQGNSTPVIWGDRIFLTQATEKGRRRSLLCFDRGAGKLLWRQTVEYNKPEPTHPTNPYCSASPVTDGERVVVSFGSAGLAAYDFAGKQLWHRSFGKCLHVWGNAASPVIHEDLVFLNFGPGERSFLVAVNKRTGEEVWRAEEPGGKLGDKGPPEWIGSWSTPTVARLHGRDEVVMSWPRVLKAYCPRTGELLWNSRGLTREGSPSQLVYTSPLASQEAIVAMSGFGGPALAVRTGGSGDMTETHQLWRLPSAPQRIGSGVILGEHLYMVNTPGTFQCFELKTGKSLWIERIGGETWSSLVCADGRLYVTTLEGETVVLAAKPAFAVLARNPLKERTLASIAVSGGALFIRTYRHLWCVGSAGQTN